MGKGRLSGNPEDDHIIRFKWFGCYLQKPKTDGYFMMRMRIPSGQFTRTREEKIRKNLQMNALGANRCYLPDNAFRFIG